jgi:hypothetical protein
MDGLTLASILCNNFTLVLADDNMILNPPLKLQYLEKVQVLENVIAKVILLRQMEKSTTMWDKKWEEEDFGGSVNGLNDNNASWRALRMRSSWHSRNSRKMRR